MRGFRAVLTGVSALAAALATGIRRDDDRAHRRHRHGERQRHRLHHHHHAPDNAPEQGAFAIRSAGHAIVKMDVASNSGMLSKSSGPNGYDDRVGARQLGRSRRDRDARPSRPIRR